MDSGSGGAACEKDDRDNVGQREESSSAEAEPIVTAEFLMRVLQLAHLYQVSHVVELVERHLVSVCNCCKGKANAPTIKIALLPRLQSGELSYASFDYLAQGATRLGLADLKDALRAFASASPELKALCNDMAELAKLSLVAQDFLRDIFDVAHVKSGEMLHAPTTQRYRLG